MTRFTLALILVACMVVAPVRGDLQPEFKGQEWDQKYERLLKDRPDIRRKVENGGATKEQVIAWMKQGGDNKKPAEVKEYYGAKIVVEDPDGFHKSGENITYSGPQPGERLPTFAAICLRGEQKGKEIDPVALAEGKPHLLIFQDNSVVGQKGLLLCGKALAKIAENSPIGLHVSTTFLVDDPTLNEIFEYDFMDEIDDVVQMSVSTDRRDGPGAYGLNRNVAMTILVARDGKVLHNFALKQPMLYPDPHVMGAIAEAIGVEGTTLAGWFENETKSNAGVTAKESMQEVQPPARQEVSDGPAVRFGTKLREFVTADVISREEARELYKLAFPANEGAERQRDYRNGREFELRDPALFSETQEKTLFSGPQPGEKLPAVTAIGVRENHRDQEFDPVAEADGKPQILVYQDESGTGLRGMILLARIVETIAEESETGLHYSAVFLGDDPELLTQQATRIDEILPDFVQMGVSKDGRDGPGAYGLNRNVSMTILLAKDGKVTHNFVFPQSMLFPDPHVLGALAQVIDEKRETVTAWLNTPSNEGATVDDGAARKAELRRRLGAWVEAGKLTREAAGDLFLAAFPVDESKRDGK